MQRKQNAGANNMNTILKWTMALLIPLFSAQGAVAQYCTTLIYLGAPQSYDINGIAPL